MSETEIHEGIYREAALDTDLYESASQNRISKTVYTGPPMRSKSRYVCV